MRHSISMLKCSGVSATVSPWNVRSGCCGRPLSWMLPASCRASPCRPLPCSVSPAFTMQGCLELPCKIEDQHGVAELCREGLTVCMMRQSAPPLLLKVKSTAQKSNAHLACWPSSPKSAAAKREHNTGIELAASMQCFNFFSAPAPAPNCRQPMCA